MQEWKMIFIVAILVCSVLLALVLLVFYGIDKEKHVSLYRRIRESKSELEDLQRQNKEYAAKIRELEQDEPDTAALTEKIGKLKQSCHALNKDKKDLQAVIERLNGEVKQRDADNARLLEENEKLRQKLDGETVLPVSELVVRYLSTGSEKAEYQLAERFREAVPLLLYFSTEDIRRLMDSAVIGSEANKSLLHSEAGSAGREDITKIV